MKNRVEFETMKQDDLETEVITKTLHDHCKMLMDLLTQLIESEAVQYFLSMRRDLAVSSILGLIFVLGLIQLIRGPIFIRLPKFLLAGFNGLSDSGQRLEYSDHFTHVIGVRGRRPRMEDRYLTTEVELSEVSKRLKPVKINAVLDGHGGEFAPIFSMKQLEKSLATKIKLLKILMQSTLTNEDKIRMLHQTSGKAEVSLKVLQHLQMTEDEYKQLHPQGRVLDPSLSASSRTSSIKSQRPSRMEASAPTSRLILSSRVKPLEEMSEPLDEDDNTIESVLTLNTEDQQQPGKRKGGKKAKKMILEKDITDFLSPAGDKIAYAALLKDVIASTDRDLLEASKKFGQLGGTTLLLSVLDGNVLWVANVGDSRGVLVSANPALQVTPLSYDHKPSQLKEKRRIEEAGGFVAMNGVWRVQGILATSRALGDYPLKDKGLLTCEPDVLSFHLDDLSGAQFALLATDGLWDVVSNENAAEQVHTYLKEHPADFSGAAEMLTNLAMDRDSLDNVTVMILDLKSRGKIRKEVN